MPHWNGTPDGVGQTRAAGHETGRINQAEEGALNSLQPCPSQQRQEGLDRARAQDSFAGVLR
jgi:hypothetical protein